MILMDLCIVARTSSARRALVTDRGARGRAGAQCGLLDPGATWGRGPPVPSGARGAPKPSSRIGARRGWRRSREKPSRCAVLMVAQRTPYVAMVSGSAASGAWPRLAHQASDYRQAGQGQHCAVDAGAGGVDGGATGGVLELGRAGGAVGDRRNFTAGLSQNGV